jgi:hypothetical protein
MGYCGFLKIKDFPGGNLTAGIVFSGACALEKPNPPYTPPDLILIVKMCVPLHRNELYRPSRIIK